MLLPKRCLDRNLCILCAGIWFPLYFVCMYLFSLAFCMQVFVFLGYLCAGIFFPWFFVFFRILGHLWPVTGACSQSLYYCSLLLLFTTALYYCSLLLLFTSSDTHTSLQAVAFLLLFSTRDTHTFAVSLFTTPLCQYFLLLLFTTASYYQRYAHAHKHTHTWQGA